MKILFLTHAFNGLAQRLFVELRAQGHEVAIEIDVNDETTAQALALARPDVVIAPFLKRAIRESVWKAVPCLVVHPGPPGDRGPSALDWAILEGEKEWGVTVLQAVGEMDAGPVWAHRPFAMRSAPKSSLYRREVTEAAVAAVTEALQGFARGERPIAAGGLGRGARGRARPLGHGQLRFGEPRLLYLRSVSLRPNLENQGQRGRLHVSVSDQLPECRECQCQGERENRSGGQHDHIWPQWFGGRQSLG